MKKLFLLFAALTTSLSISAFATSDFTPLTTLDQAQQYCPAINGLTFTATNTLPNSGGTIAGNNRATFANFPDKATVRPKNMNANGVIQDVQFRSANGMYGYLSGNAITCLYSYTSALNGVLVMLTMRS